MGGSKGGLTKRLVVVDAQEVFLSVTDWHIPTFTKIIGNIARLANHFGDATIFSKHVPPLGEPVGTWSVFYKTWEHIGVDPTIWDLATPLSGLPGREISKSTYSCFGSTEFTSLIGSDSHLVIAGVETDCCVMATVLDAVDAGFPVTVVTDAVTSPSPIAHEGSLAFLSRIPLQVQIKTTDEVLASI